MGSAILKCAGEFSISRSTFSAPIIPITPIEPDAIGGLVLWLKADAGVTLSGSNVTAWADQSGNGNNAYILNSGQEPYFQSNSINGNPSVNFDGQGQVMQINDSTSLDVTALSVFIVLLKEGNGRGNDVVFLKNGDTVGNSAIYGLVAYTSGGWVASYDIGVNWQDHNSGFSINNDNNPHIVGYNVNSSQSLSFQDQASPNNLGANGTIATSDGSLQIGGYNQSFNNPNGEFFNGRIAEFILYNNAISAENKNGLFSYLNNKYAIY